MKRIERYRGSLLGLAAGDALGTTLEFKQPGTFKPIKGIVGGGPFGLQPGEWTDDTSMALCLAESLIERKGFDPVDQLSRYVRWMDDGHLSSTGRCFDIGNATRQALENFKRKPQAYCGSTDPSQAGNGSIMRLAPVPLAYARAGGEAVEKAAESSKTTHGSREAVDGCRYLAALIVGAAEGMTKAELLSENFFPISNGKTKDSIAPKIAEIAAGSFKRKNPPEIRGTGYVVKSLEAALWAFFRSDSFEEGALLAVNLGDDADTTGAVYGQLAGCYYGERGIPSSWLAKLKMRDVIEDYADRLFALSEVLGSAKGTSR